MDLWVSLLIIFGSIAAVLALFIIYVRTPKGRGWFGEVLVSWVLGKDKEGKRRVVSDLIIEGKDGRTTQIDHVVINANGVFVIETKNYAGDIYGDETCSEWTQILAGGKVRNKHYNPVKQNGTHVYMLKEALGLPIHIMDAVVLVQGNTKHIASDRVFTVWGVRGFLSKKRHPGLSAGDIESIFSKLEEIKKNTKITPEQHRENIRRQRADIEAGICPRCRGRLVKMQDENGEYTACSNYPTCRFTMTDR